MMNVLKMAAAALTLVGSAAHGEGTVFIYEQDLEGVFSQAWYAAYLERRDGNTHEVYVKGDGKLGDFHGVLYLDCDQPRYSEWIAQGDYLNPSAVPQEAVAAIREKYC